MSYVLFTQLWELFLTNQVPNSNTYSLLIPNNLPRCGNYSIPNWLFSHLYILFLTNIYTAVGIIPHSD